MKVSRIATAGATALAACAVLGAVPPAVQASSASSATWTQQAPATSPPSLEYPAMAYDAATSTAVLFGGFDHETWTWNGTTWTQQHPAVHPPGRVQAAMAYDAATGTVVLFGGEGNQGANDLLGDTWTWNGTTWTKQAPAVHPPARLGAAMAYDAATGTVVLFGGFGRSNILGDTWAWNGTTWTKQVSATSPSVRGYPGMAYDAAIGNAVLFGGEARGGGNLHDTWTWNGTTWAQQHPATSPRARYGEGMAYDAASGAVVLFGGFNSRISPYYLGDTWTWNGTTWAQQHPATSPSARANPAMAYDAATGTVVLFGGVSPSGSYLGDTWTWG